MLSSSFSQQAIASIPEFMQKYKNFRNHLRVHQYSEGTIYSYSSKLSCICVQLGKCPEDFSQLEVDSYFNSLLIRKPQPGISYFRHTVASLSAYFRFVGISSLSFKLPPIRKESKLPVVFSQKEIRRLLRCCPDLKYKSAIALAYSAGMRMGEVLNLHIRDIDMDRMSIHIRQSKNRKDRYVPLSQAILIVLRAYMKESLPSVYLFNGSQSGTRLQERELSFAFKQACRTAKINKKVVFHTLRHSYATHLIEMGENIVRISNLLGHSNLETTLTYLHLISGSQGEAFSPLDRLFPIAEKQ